MNLEVFDKIIRDCDFLVSKLLLQQELHPDHKWYGGVKDEYGIHNLGDTTALIRSAVCSYLMPKSKYYRTNTLLERTETAVKYLLKSQYEDGTADFHHTNFHSTPDIAFALEKLCAIYHILIKNNRNEFKNIKLFLKEYILKGGEALINGGVHTPNHRWVICMALAWVNSLFENTKYINRIDEWLSEGIDIDEDGQFTEKSAAIYSPLCCRCFITIARLLNRPELYEYVRKNLDMTVYLMHPNGEAVTLNSERQDRGKVEFMAAYYIPYRYMGIKDNNPLYSAMAWKILQTAHDLMLPSYLIFYLEDPLLRQDMPKMVNLPEEYEKFFKNSNCVRIKSKELSVTICSKQDGFVSIHKNHAVIRKIRLASAFFGKGQFVAEEIKKEGNSYVLEQKLQGVYYQPLPKENIRKDGNWSLMDHSKRIQSEICELYSVISISVKSGFVKIEVSVKGTDNVPVSLEIGFNKGGKLIGVEQIKGIENAYLLEHDCAKYVFGNDIIDFGPGHVEHSWTQLRGALPKLDAECVYLTGVTPFNIRLNIKQSVLNSKIIKYQ